MATPAKQPQRTSAKPTPAARPAAPAAAAKPAAKPAPAAPAKTGVVVRPQTQVTESKAANQLPDYMRTDTTRGSEQVEMQDLVIPRIELVQALSECLKEGSGDYIEGAKAGMFYNSVTRQLYGDSVTVCPVFFKKQFLAWRDRKKGGGFGGAFDSMQECIDRIATEDNADEWEAVETAQQIVLVVDMDDPEYGTSEAVLSCARTKMKVSRQWNSLIRVNGFDRFSRLYELFGVDETNANNEGYKNFSIRYIDYAPQSVYKAGEALYESIASGVRKVKIDDDYIDGGLPPEDTGPGSEPVGKEY